MQCNKKVHINGIIKHFAIEINLSSASSLLLAVLSSRTADTLMIDKDDFLIPWSYFIHDYL